MFVDEGIFYRQIRVKLRRYFHFSYARQLTKRSARRLDKKRKIL